ncbi:hypothetical protein ACFLUU_01410 [Chloroflexota bacterium]
MRNNAKIGGILSTLSGVMGFVWLTIILFSAFSIVAMFGLHNLAYRSSPLPLESFTGVIVFYLALALFVTLISILGIVGGVYALKRKRWGLALAGAIAGTFTFFPCGIPAIIFVTLAKQEFSTTPE